jgi:hypothetical protein
MAKGYEPKKLLVEGQEDLQVIPSPSLMKSDVCGQAAPRLRSCDRTFLNFLARFI